jgi:hypothetical protein
MELDVSDIDINQYWVNISRFWFLQEAHDLVKVWKVYTRRKQYMFGTRPTKEAILKQIAQS